MIMSTFITYSAWLGMTINEKIGLREVGCWWEKMVWCVLGCAFLGIKIFMREKYLYKYYLYGYTCSRILMWLSLCMLEKWMHAFFLFWLRFLYGVSSHNSCEYLCKRKRKTLLKSIWVNIRNQRLGCDTWVILFKTNWIKL